MSFSRNHLSAACRLEGTERIDLESTLVGGSVKHGELHFIGEMVRKRGSPRGLVALFITLAITASCSRDSALESRAKDLHRRFQISGKGYLLNEKEPGVIDDDAIVYTADAGARTFNFKTRTVLRHFYVGRWEEFDALPPDERRETRDLANGALDFISRLEKQQQHLSEVDHQHREILKAFLASPRNTQTATTEMPRPHVRNCNFSQYHPLRISSDWIWRGGIVKRVEPSYPSEAKRERLQGRVFVTLLISGDGDVEQACAEGPQFLRDAAETAALQWVFRTPRLNGEKIPYIQGSLGFNFVLDGPSVAYESK